MDKENKSKNIIIVLLSILIVLLVIAIIVGIISINTSKKQSNTSDENRISEESNLNSATNVGNNNIVNGDNSINMNTTENPATDVMNNTIGNSTSSETNSTMNSTINSTTSTTTPNTTGNDSVSAINTAIVKGAKISVPATKESFANTGWEWDAKYANTDLATGYTTSGGRLGKYPGGAVVSVINNSGQTKKIQDCTIDSITFYNPGDGSENVTFIGGLNYNSTTNDVKSTFSKLGYKAGKERNYEKSNYYTYYLNDNSSNYRDYIEFSFFDGTIRSVTIKSSIK